MKPLVWTIALIAPRQAGFLLMPVALLLALVAAAAFALTLQSGLGAGAAVRSRDTTDVLLVAQAGMSHARFAANVASCSGYTLPSEDFGPHSYSAVFTPTSGSPVSMAATGTLAGGLTHTIARDAVTVFEPEQVEVLQPGAAGKDATLAQLEVVPIDGTESQIGLSTTSSGSPAVSHGVFHFDLSTVPTSATVLSAELELYQLDASQGGTGSASVHRITTPWSEADASWTQATSGTSWSAPGGDYEVSAAARTTLEPTVGWFRWNVTSLVDGWISSSTPNLGLLLRPEDPLPARSFASSEHTDVALRPKLIIRFACECDVDGTAGTLVEQPGLDGEDTYISEKWNLENYGSDWEIGLRLSGADKTRGLLRFDISKLPTGAAVTNARLEMYQTSTGSDGNVAIHRVTEAWVEGTGDNTGCWDGASWLQRDGACGTWSTAGGAYDPELMGSSWVDDSDVFQEWDVTDLVSDWHDGTHPNYGMIMIPDPMMQLYFTTGDASNASWHPKLTIDYYCPCGVVCAPPGLWGDRLLLVVVDAENPTSGEAAHRALFQSWGFAVSLLSANADQAAYDAALAVSDVVYVTEDISSGDVAFKLSTTEVGVVTEETNLSDELGLAAGIVWESGDRFDIVDDTHSITEPFSTGSLTVLSASESLARLTAPLAPDLAVLATRTGEPVFAALEQGGERHDALGGAEGRRVQLPWGGDGHDVSTVNADGRTLVERSLQWAATPATSPSGYLDRFGLASCVASSDYSGSHGTLQWAGTTWQETDDGDSCGGDIQIRRQNTGHRLRIAGDGTGIEREVDTSAFSVATLRFRYRAEGAVSPLRFLRVMVSGDGGANFSQVAMVAEPGDGTYQTSATGIDTMIASDTVIRFAAWNLTSGAEVWIDDVEVVEESTIVGCLDTYRDQFDDKRYDNDDGTLSWSTDWLEINESDGATSGDTQVRGGADVTNALRIQDNDGGGEGAEREADLSGAANATLTFSYKLKNFDDSDDFVTVEASADGGATWTELDRFEGPANTGFLDGSVPLGAHLAPNTRIRFLGSPDLGNKDEFFADDVEICLQ